MSLNYATFVQRIADLSGLLKSDANLPILVPGAIEYAEQRIYRELDLQVSRVSDSTTNLSSGVRNFTLPTASGTFIVVEQINVITPVGATAASSGSRTPLVPVTKEYLDFAWPNSKTNTGVPIYFAPLNNTTYILGPSPDAAYNVEVIGTQRPVALSASNSSTYLTQYIPDVFTAAAMIYVTGSKRTPGIQPADPNAPAAWEAQYKTLMQSAAYEEFRRRFASQGWQAMAPNPIAIPPRQ